MPSGRALCSTWVRWVLIWACTVLPGALKVPFGALQVPPRALQVPPGASQVPPKSAPDSKKPRFFNGFAMVLTMCAFSLSTGFCSLLGDPFGRTWAPFGATWALLGTSWAQLGASWAPFWPNWAPLGRILAPFGPILAALGPILVRLGLNFDAPRANLDFLECLLGPTWRLLGTNLTPLGHHNLNWFMEVPYAHSACYNVMLCIMSCIGGLKYLIHTVLTTMWCYASSSCFPLC